MSKQKIDSLSTLPLISTGYIGYENESYGSLQDRETSRGILLPDHGGYDCEFVDPPTADLQTKCDICSLVLCNPYQTQCCGSIFCKSCVKWVQKQKQPCPRCNKAEFSTFHDKSSERTINTLKVKCIHQRSGCAWTGELVELDRHLNVNPACDELLVGCEFVTIKCKFNISGCKAQVYRKDMETHMKHNESHHLHLLADALKERDKQIKKLNKKLQKKNELLEKCTLQKEELTSKLQKIKQQATNVGFQLWNQLPEPVLIQIYDLLGENKELQLLLGTPTPRQLSVESSRRIPVSHYFTMEKFEFHKTNNKSWCSEPFYTHEQGYKMCLQTYANGYDRELGTHLSLFTCFLRGEYDDQLQWPFHGKIAVELLDQSTDDLTQGKHHECIIHYDGNTPDHYVQRVEIVERGPGWGKSQFLPHFLLDPGNDTTVQYLKDDCLKFQVREVLLYT